MNRPLTAAEAAKNINVAKADRYKVHRGEAGRNVVTELKDGLPVIENPPAIQAPSPSSLLPAVVGNQNHEKPTILSRYDKIANLRLALILRP